MSDLAPATSQPASPTQTSDAKSDNRSGSEAKRQFLTSFLERQKAADAPAAAPVVETVTPASPAPLADTPATTTEQTAPAVQTPPAPEAAPVETVPVTTEPPETALDEGDDAAANDVLSQLSSFDAKTQKLVRDFMDQWTQRRHEKIQKKIDKERAMRGDLAKELAELKAKPVPQPEIQRVALPSESSPLADVNDVQTLTQRHSEAKEARRWAQVALDNEQWERVNVGGREVDAVREGERYFTKAEVKGILRNAESALEDHIPQRLNFLQRREQVRAAARTDFPFLADKNSPEYQQVQAAYNQRPWLMNDPEAELIIAAAVDGLKNAEARRKAASTATTTTAAVKPAAQKPPASQTAVPATAAAVRTSGEAEARRKVQAEREKLGTKGNVTSADLKRYFLNSSQSR